MLERNDLLPIVQRNQKKIDTAEAYESILTGKRHQDFIEYIVDLREYDIPFHVRFAIDNGDFIATFTSVMSFYLKCGKWYDVSVSNTGVILEKRTDLLQRAEVHVCAFDIETTKLPLKFPDAEIDSIMMISYIVDGQGYLIINRECVWEDIEDLEYTPKPEFEGYFKVKNVKNEEELLRQWFVHIREVKPGIYVTYNGDFFDWPFLETRVVHPGGIFDIKHLRDPFTVEVLNIKSWVAKPTVRQPKARIALYVVVWFYLKAARANDEVDKTTKYLAVLSLLGHERLCYWLVNGGYEMEGGGGKGVTAYVSNHGW
ncbi:hypothetical protein IFM89_002695 [Coptis chinensis]|uniref:DNA polymerase epsilon catalytic subunit n=1 Tax=Coptis chinensis TaxID=261450 RepID=A0A835IM81_9MAGN|nr:hypothetical protein IFM89_002695 [Coptis chinensis]